MGLLARLKKSFNKHLSVRNIEGNTNTIKDILVENYLQKNLRENPRYQGKKLNRYECQVFSQSGEDGIIAEIFQRIGPTNRFFVEFGAGNGSENNSAYLLIQDWQGLWMDSGEKNVRSILASYQALVQEQRLSVKNAFITAENIEQLFTEAAVPAEFDLLSIDIDRNDYWVWKALNAYRPRVVVIEYNAIYPPPVQWIVRYEPHISWDLTSHMGASLKSLELLGSRKGYKLVGCNFAGGNAFFVREDLVADKFCDPFTAENHFEPPRYFLVRRIGHSRRFGDFVRD
jgi:hypothetical protein